jgi:hypothetical protein
MTKFIPVLGLLALAACGGGGGGGTTTGGGGGGGGGGGNPDSFLDPGATQSFSLTTFSSEGGAASTTHDPAQGPPTSRGG